MQNFDHNIGFWEKRQFFRRKLAKIAENCDHNIDPWLAFGQLPFIKSTKPGADIDNRMFVTIFGKIANFYSAGLLASS
jgi:hypothetical protein